MPNYPWYELVSGSNILQGDLLDGCPVLVPQQDFYVLSSEQAVEREIPFKEYNVIVMSQSCDIEEGKVDLILVCPYRSLEELGQRSHFFRSSNGKEALRKGNTPGCHLLNKCELKGMERDYMVVDFRNVYSLPLEFLKGFADKADKRIRLLPPYREHLSQAFARFLMRVGLPADIPPFS